MPLVFRQIDGSISSQGAVATILEVMLPHSPPTRDPIVPFDSCRRSLVLCPGLFNV